MKHIINLNVRKTLVLLFTGIALLSASSAARAQIATNIYGGITGAPSTNGIYYNVAHMTNGLSTSIWLPRPTNSVACLVTNISNITNHTWVMYVTRKSDQHIWLATNAPIYFPATNSSYSITLFDYTSPGVPAGTLLQTEAVWY